jgi:polyhydroxybutyrate depolymerase
MTEQPGLWRAIFASLSVLAPCACGGSPAVSPSGNGGGPAPIVAEPPASAGGKPTGGKPGATSASSPAGEGVGNVTGIEGAGSLPPLAAGGSAPPAPSAGCGSPAGLTSGRASIDVAGETREYILLVPEDYDPAQPYRLIFGWHPWGGSAQQTESRGYFGLEGVSDGQAILVAPEGRDFRGNGLGWGNENGSDLEFLQAMLGRFGSELCIDENRIFSTGFSFGAMFSFTLACSSEGRMRAIAPQAGNATTSGPCEDGTRSVATLAFIGTDDSLLEGHRQAVDILVERNGCSTPPAPLSASWCDGLDESAEPCSCVEYPGCKQGYPVIACEYNAGHQFAPNAGATLWSFFSQF